MTIVLHSSSGGNGEKNYERFKDAAAIASTIKSHEPSSPGDVEQQSQHSSRSSFDSLQPYDEFQIQQQHPAVSLHINRESTEKDSLSPAKHMPASSSSNTLDSAIALVTLRHGTLSPVSCFVQNLCY